MLYILLQICLLVDGFLFFVNLANMCAISNFNFHAGFQVSTFGSVPLKTYLPDGDIDLTAFSDNENLKDAWATAVCGVLENEEKSENAEFCVKEVKYIQAEV